MSKGLNIKEIQEWINFVSRCACELNEKDLKIIEKLVEEKINKSISINNMLDSKK